jgi:hypothetical protein
VVAVVRVHDLNPSVFAFVLAIGIVSTALRTDNLPSASGVLLMIGVARPPDRLRTRWTSGAQSLRRYYTGASRPAVAEFHSPSHWPQCSSGAEFVVMGTLPGQSVAPWGRRAERR